jgi:AraC-like DNA-binding protein
MRMTTFAPSAALSTVVTKFLVVESDVEVMRAVLPDVGGILGVRFAGSATHGAARMPFAAVTGIQQTVRHMTTQAGSGIVLVNFKPGGAAAVLRVPMHELFGKAIGLDAILGRAEAARMIDRVASAPDNATRVAILDAILVQRVGEIDPLVTAAARAIDAARGSLRIADLARTLRITQDPLEKRFRRTVGSSPKHLASIVRVRHAVDLAREARSTRGTMSAVAYEAGYFDQSHFNREFRSITGQAPSVFFRDHTYC